MKNVPWIVWVVFFVIAGTGWGLWIHDKFEKPELAHLAAITQTPGYRAPNVTNPPNSPGQPPVATSMPSQGLSREYSMARQKVLQDNPGLAAEYSEIQAEMKAQLQKFNAAMIQADPKVAPVIAKLDAMRQRAMGGMNAPHPNPTSAPATPGK